MDTKDPYHKMLLERMTSEPWVEKVFVTGFLSDEDVVRILAAADAVLYKKHYKMRLEIYLTDKIKVNRNIIRALVNLMRRLDL